MNSENRANAKDNISQHWGTSTPSDKKEGLERVAYQPPEPPKPPEDNFLNRVIIITIAVLAGLGFIAAIVLPAFNIETSDLLISITSACIGALVNSVRSWKPG